MIIEKENGEETYRLIHLLFFHPIVVNRIVLGNIDGDVESVVDDGGHNEVDDVLDNSYFHSFPDKSRSKGNDCIHLQSHLQSHLQNDLRSGQKYAK